MKVKDIMTADPVCGLPESSLIEIARIMVGYDCGEVPIVESKESKTLVGVITDRDIVVRTLGQELNPTSMKASEIMSVPAVSISVDASIEECVQFMEDKQIRRVPVIDDKSAIIGIVALADLTKYTSEKDSGAVLEEVSRDIGAASNVAY